MTDETIISTALEKADPTERAAYLDGVCAGDAERRQRLEALLASSPHDSDSGETCTIGHESGAATDDEVPLGFLAPATRPDGLGRLGHYEVLQVLGQGGFGIVFRAFDDVLHRVVAVKVLSPQLAATSPARLRFLREARSSAQVRHRNVVQVYEVGEQPLPYLVMEFIPGETLQQRLDRVGPVKPAEVVQVGRQIAEGLAAAHANDLIHRDVKPGNILLEGGSQRVKLTDFGLARAADDASLTQSGIIAGTPMYMAPEQAQGERLDQRADLFSLGSVLYQMVCGRPPFRANTTLAVLKRVVEDTPRDIREIIPETPQWLCAIIAKLHAKNPDERYQSAREVADVLGDCEAQLKAQAGPKDYSRILCGKGRRAGRRTWVAAAGALLLPALALAVTEATGVTRLFRGPQATLDANTMGNKSAPVAKPEPPADPKAAKDQGPDRKAAEYVLSLGGAVKVNGEASKIKAAADLPREPFRLTVVDLHYNTQVTDEGLAVFKDCTSVTILCFYFAKPVSDAGLAHFAGCKNLTQLHLQGTRVTNAGLARFKGATIITELYLSGPGITDEGIANFKGCKELTHLSLYGTRVTAAGLNDFKDCGSLEYLVLGNTAADDEWVALFKDCKHLRVIFLTKTQVTDAGLVDLAGLPKLTTLRLAGTQVTAQGVAGLAKALPQCNIMWNGGVLGPK